LISSLSEQKLINSVNTTLICCYCVTKKLWLPSSAEEAVCNCLRYVGLSLTI